MGVLIFLLLGSSLLLQAFSWLWYNYYSEEERECIKEHIYLEKYLKNRNFLKALHVCQLGVVLRFAGVMEISMRNLRTRKPLTEGIAVYLTHDLSLLRLIETFSESTPQLTLMITIIAHREDVEWVTGLKTLASFGAIAFSVVMYHRSMRSFNRDKAQLSWTSSLVYFMWNFLLIGSRVATVALFASSLPLMIAVHFVCLWLTLLLWAWLQKTDFMENMVGEWLYRATVALIWYFSWFNISKGGSRGRSIIYHSIIAVDITLLLVLWWESDQGASIFGMPAWAVFILMGASYTVGILVKITYYKLFHPKKSAPEIKLMMMSTDERACASLEEEGVDEVDSRFFFKAPSPPSPPKPLTGAQKRMQKLADNFYS